MLRDVRAGARELMRRLDAALLVAFNSWVVRQWLLAIEFEKRLL